MAQEEHLIALNKVQAGIKDRSGRVAIDLSKRSIQGSKPGQKEQSQLRKKLVYRQESKDMSGKASHNLKQEQSR